MTGILDINRAGRGLQFGEIEVTRIEDYHGPGFVSTFMFPDFRPDMWRQHESWLVPHFYDPVENKIRTSIHSWLVRTKHHTILIDSCIGNHKQRPTNPRFHMRNEPWLERLAAAGARSEDVDFVMCTHLHSDHVGWNTRLENGRWVPTFPNARYLFTRNEFERWDERRPDHVPRESEQFVFADSVLPVEEAGQMELIEEGYTVDDLLTVEAAYGHTPGHVKIRLKGHGEHALFCGDVIHHPVQLPYPELYSVFDDDRVTALQTRLAVLDDCARNDILLLPTHFADPFLCRIQSTGDQCAPSYLPLWGR